MLTSSEEKLPHRTLHMDERQRRLEWVTFVTPADYFPDIKQGLNIGICVDWSQRGSR